MLSRRFCPKEKENESRMDILGSLPVELQERILEGLEPEELAPLELVCKRWKASVNMDRLWRRPLLKRYPLEAMALQPKFATPGESWYKVCYSRGAGAAKRWRTGKYRRFSPGPTTSQVVALANGSVLVALNETGRLSVYDLDKGVTRVGTVDVLRGLSPWPCYSFGNHLVVRTNRPPALAVFLLTSDVDVLKLSYFVVWPGEGADPSASPTPVEGSSELECSGLNKDLTVKAGTRYHLWSLESHSVHYTLEAGDVKQLVATPERIYVHRDTHLSALDPRGGERYRVEVGAEALRWVLEGGGGIAASVTISGELRLWKGSDGQSLLPPTPGFSPLLHPVLPLLVYHTQISGSAWLLRSLSFASSSPLEVWSKEARPELCLTSLGCEFILVWSTSSPWSLLDWKTGSALATFELSSWPRFISDKVIGNASYTDLLYFTP